MKLSNYQRRKLSLQAIELFRQHLFKNKKKLASLLEINLKFSNIDAWGICDCHDVGIKPREFTIYIDRNLADERNIITTVAHEMVHVWQYATGKLRDYEAPVHRYENYLYDADMSYRDMPWEIEARQLEKKLYNLWAKHQSVR
jgi:hypothetical protein